MDMEIITIQLSTHCTVEVMQNTWEKMGLRFNAGFIEGCTHEE
jgi:hypothetical protein